MNLVFINIKKYFLSCSILFLRRNQLLRYKMRKFCFLTLLFSFFFFSCAMNQESGGSVVITMPEKTEAVRAITDFETSYTITISGPTSIEPKNARAGETIQFSELASGNYSERLRIPLRRKDRSAFISKGKDDRQSF